MMRLRFSTSVLMSIVCLAALVFAASSYSGSLDLDSLIALTASVPVLGLLCTAPLGACLKRGEKRGFWLGFAVFGWSSVIAGWLTHDFPIGFFAVVGSIPFGYIGGTIGRKFAAERSGE